MAQYIKTEEGYKGLEKSISAVTDNKMDKTNPTGTGSFSMNRKAGTVIGGASHAEGYDTTASGYGSHAEGNNTTASGGESHAEGNQTTVSGRYSHAEGNSTNKFSSVVTTTNPTTDDIINVWKNKKFSVAKGDCSHVEGEDNLALGDYSHAEGCQTTANGFASHAEGGGTTANGFDSHAEGGGTTASGYYSHAEGNNTTASGQSSHAEGFDTTASGNYSHVQGKYNIEDTSNKYADIIGNGTITKRSNAATVDWKGNAWFAGDVYTGSTSGTNKDNGSKKLATEEYVNSSIAATSVLYTAQSLTEEEQAQARANIGAGTPYTLPQATAEALGGVKADPATADDTQPVRIGGDGKLYTAAGSTDISLGLTSAAVGQIIKVKAIDASGKPTAWEAVDIPSAVTDDHINSLIDAKLRTFQAP